MQWRPSALRSGLRYSQSLLRQERPVSSEVLPTASTAHFFFLSCLYLKSSADCGLFWCFTRDPKRRRNSQLALAGLTTSPLEKHPACSACWDRSNGLPREPLKDRCMTITNPREWQITNAGHIWNNKCKSAAVSMLLYWVLILALHYWIEPPPSLLTSLLCVVGTTEGLNVIEISIFPSWQRRTCLLNGDSAGHSSWHFISAHYSYNRWALSLKNVIFKCVKPLTLQRLMCHT